MALPPTNNVATGSTYANLNDDQKLRLFSSTVIQSLYQNNILIGQTDRSWEAEARRAGVVYIPKSGDLDDFDGLEDYDHTLVNPNAQTGYNWPTPQRGDQFAYTPLSINEHRSQSYRIPLDIGREVSFNVMTDVAMKIGEKIALEVDHHLLGRLCGDGTNGSTDTYALKSGFDTVVPDVGLGTGTKGTFVNSDLDGVTEDNALAIGKGVYEALNDARLHANRLNLRGRATRMSDRMAVIMPPVIEHELNKYLASLDHVDQLKYEQITGMNLIQGYRGSLFGTFDLFCTNSFSEVELSRSPTTSGKKHFAIPIIIPGETISFADHPRQIDYWPPEGSPFGPYHRWNVLYEYGSCIVREDRMMRFYIRAEK